MRGRLAGVAGGLRQGDVGNAPGDGAPLLLPHVVAGLAWPRGELFALPY
jgi:hypothetical protein